MNLNLYFRDKETRKLLANEAARHNLSISGYIRLTLRVMRKIWSVPAESDDSMEVVRERVRKLIEEEKARL